MKRLAIAMIVLAVAGNSLAADPVALRLESLTVAPPHQPSAIVDVKNLADSPYQGSIKVKAPDGWRIAPVEQKVSLEPGETKRVSFRTEAGLNLAANRYPFMVSAESTGKTVVRRQEISCASAPYFKPTMDGDPAEWKDAIPITFTVGGKKTVLSTYWNRRQFCILAAVEEDKLLGRGAADQFDALQVALSPQDSKTGTSPDQEANRFEFLFVPAADGKSASCFQLASPGMKLSEAARCRSLDDLRYEKAEVAVSRDGDVTYYECSLSFSPMRSRIRPSEGREFFFSVLVHDPDGTGVRDWGAAAGLWPSQRNRLAWSQWKGARWGEKPPFDNKVEWGLCSSKY